MPNWFPPLARNHPAFFLSYSFTILLNAGLAICYAVIPARSFDLGYLRLVNMVPRWAWGGSGALIAALLMFGLRPGRFQWGRAGFAIGVLVWFTRGWLMLCALWLDGERISSIAVLAFFYAALMHIPQGVEPPINPVTQTEIDIE